jgi:alpha-L-rhamnosidase
MNSFNHYAFGAIGAWLYAVVGGVDLDPACPGYKHIVLRPRPGGGLTSARVEMHSPYGLIRSAWAMTNASLEWRVTIPPNTNATLFVPIMEGAKVVEGDLPAANAPGVRFLRRETGAEVYAVTSGEYQIIAR